MQSDALQPDSEATEVVGKRPALKLSAQSRGFIPANAMTKEQRTAQVLGSMLDRRPTSAQIPGYTGHQPGMVSESLLGRSYPYLTGYRKDLIFKRDEAWISEYDRSVCKGGSNFEPLLTKQPISGANVARPVPQAQARHTWGNRQQFCEVLNLSESSRMPGYTGHVPHFKFQGSVGLPYAKACSTGDQLRAPDGSDNKYIHENPQHVGQPKHKIATEPIAGYAGFIPCMQDSSCGHSYRDALKVCHETQAIDPVERRKIVDNVHAAYTPSMRKALTSARPHGKTSRDSGGEMQRLAVRQEPPPRIAGYAGFKPGNRVSPHAPVQFNNGDPNVDHTASARGSTLYLGDLTQEWNLGTPYRCTNGDYGLWSSSTANQGGKRAPLWNRRR